MPNDGDKRVLDDQIGNRQPRGLLDSLDPFVAAPYYMVCDECDEFIPLDAHGFSYDHTSLDTRVIREAYATLTSKS